MEGPMSSSVNKKINNIASEDCPSEEEESGWTAYLEDFSCSNASFVSSSPSLVSDAAWNGTADSFSQVRRLNFKNTKRSNYVKKYSCDDDLEDTASSPVNSPKVSSLKHMEVNYPRIEDVAGGNFLGKQAANNFSTDEKNGKNVVKHRNADQYVDLGKRGLCLVPMSMLMNYLG